MSHQSPLGCENHRAYVYDRGGGRRIGEITGFTSIRWSRVRDDISSATLFHFVPGKDCATLLRDTEPGRHELVVFRGGHRVWEGPITRLAVTRDTAEVEAHDVLWWATRTIMRSAHSNAYPHTAAVTDRAAQIILTEMDRKEAQDPPINVLPFLDVRTNDDTARTTRSTLPYQKYVWEEMDEMAAKAGLDYTVIGRRIVLWDTHDSIGQTQQMTESDFLDDVTLTGYGMELCTYSAVTDNNGNWGAWGAGANEADANFYGEIELLASAYGEAASAADAPAPTTAEMISQAKRNLAGRYPTPTIVRVPDGSGLNPSCVALTFDHLVPGVAIPVFMARSIRPMRQLQKLDQVVIEEDADGERVSVTMSPFPGTTPWDDSQGESSGSGSA